MSEQSRAKWHRILLAQKQEFEFLAAEPYVERLGLVAAQKLLPSPLAKVILGPRRAGKSIFALQLCKNKKTAYCNFDDDELIHLVKQDGIETLITELKEVYGECHYYLFDEIQAHREIEWVPMTADGS